MIQNRTARFWIMGSFLWLGSAAYIGYKLVALKQSLTTPELFFMGGVLFTGLATFDVDTAKMVLQAVMFWKKNGTLPPQDGEGGAK